MGIDRSASRKRARGILLTGQRIDAPTALAEGLVNLVVPADALNTEIRWYADFMIARSLTTIRVGKQTFYRQIEHPLETAYDIASESMARMLLREEAAEGMDAIHGKR